MKKIKLHNITFLVRNQGPVYTYKNDMYSMSSTGK